MGQRQNSKLGDWYGLRRDGVVKFFLTERGELLKELKS